MATIRSMLRLRRGVWHCSQSPPAPAMAQDKPDNWLTRLFQPPASGSGSRAGAAARANGAGNRARPAIR